MDMAIVRGLVSSGIEYIKGDGSTRAQFTVGLELSQKVQRAGSPEATETSFSTLLATTEPSLTERCRTLLDKGDEVMMIGYFGYHKGRLKMRVTDIDLPELRIQPT